VWGGAQPRLSSPARPEFPAVLSFRGGDGLPVQVRHRVRAATGEGDHVILALYRLLLPGMQGGCDLARPPERQHVHGFHFLTSLGVG